MDLFFDCMTCNINQTVRVLEMLEVDRPQKEEIMREMLDYLRRADYSKSNPQILGDAWPILTKYANTDDLYRPIKTHYNMALKAMGDEICKTIEDSPNKLQMALKVAIAGNMIDFASRHEFSIDILKNKIAALDKTIMPVDDSNALFQAISQAKHILYLGDNCGEIFLDKVFIEYIKETYPDVKVTFAVRGKPVLNDVVIEDASMVDMDEVATVISNGDNSLGTVLERVSPEFLETFHNADVIISKGLGNFESLIDLEKENIYFLFMAKCKPIADLLNVPQLSIVCVNAGKTKIGV